MLDENIEVCGLCKYHKRDGDFPDDFICCCEDSDYVGDYTDYDFSCEEWEEKE